MTAKRGTARVAKRSLHIFLMWFVLPSERRKDRTDSGARQHQIPTAPLLVGTDVAERVRAQSAILPAYR